jgi:hypothetical protein
MACNLWGGPRARIEIIEKCDDLDTRARMKSAFLSFTLFSRLPMPECAHARVSRLSNLPEPIPGRLPYSPAPPSPSCSSKTLGLGRSRALSTVILGAFPTVAKATRVTATWT